MKILGQGINPEWDERLIQMTGNFNEINEKPLGWVNPTTKSTEVYVYEIFPKDICSALRCIALDVRHSNRRIRRAKANGDATSISLSLNIDDDNDHNNHNNAGRISLLFLCDSKSWGGRLPTKH
jgi:hypothetical protein